MRVLFFLTYFYEKNDNEDEDGYHGVNDSYSAE